MGMRIKGIGKMINRMATASIGMQTALITRATGLMTSRKARAKSHGLTIACIEASIKTARSMGSDCSFGATGRATKACGRITGCTERAYSNGQMAECSKVNMKTIKSMDSEC